MSQNAEKPKQTRETARRAREIRRLRSHNVKWEEVSRRVGVLKDDGSPDTGLAYKIGFEDYEPASPEVRDRLGLRRLCTACGRGFRNVARAVSDLPPWRSWWNRLKPWERDRMIRKNYEKEGKG